MANYTLQQAKDILANTNAVRPVFPDTAHMPQFVARVYTFLTALIASPNVTDVYVILDPKHDPGYFYIGEMYECAGLLGHVDAWTFDYVSSRGDSVLAQCLVQRVCNNAPSELTILSSLVIKASSPACMICSLRQGLTLAELPTTRRVNLSGMQLRDTVELHPDRALRIAQNHSLEEFQFPYIMSYDPGECDKSYNFIREEVAAVVKRNVRQKQ